MLAWRDDPLSGWRRHEGGAGALSASELADLAGVTEVEIDRLVDLGVLVARNAPGSFDVTDAQNVLLATACEQAGLPMEGIAAAIRAAGCHSRSWSRPAPKVGGALGMDLPPSEPGDEGAPGGASRIPGVQSFAQAAPEQPIRKDELEVVPCCS
jgi:hypothetical protein